MAIQDYFKKKIAKDFAGAYRHLFEGKYNPGLPTLASVDLSPIRREDIRASPIRLAHISDLHIGNHSPEKLQDLTRTLKTLKPNFLVISGDIVHYPEVKLLQKAKGILQTLAGTCDEMLLIPGNHDRHGELDLNTWASELDSGASPLFQCRMYELSNQRFIFFFLLNSTIAKTGGGIDQTIHDLVQVRGWIDDAQVTWLRKMHVTIQEHYKTEYARGMKVAVLHHHPLPVGDDGYLTEAFMSLGNSNQVLSIFADMKIDLVLHGHKHVPAVRSLNMADRGHRLTILSAGTALSIIGKRADDNAKQPATNPPSITPRREEAQAEEEAKIVSSQCGFFVVEVHPKSVLVDERRYINKIPLPDKYVSLQSFKFPREVRTFSRIEIETEWTIKFPDADWQVHETHRVLGHSGSAETEYEFDLGCSIPSQFSALGFKVTRTLNGKPAQAAILPGVETTSYGDGTYIKGKIKLDPPLGTNTDEDLITFDYLWPKGYEDFKQVNSLDSRWNCLYPVDKFKLVVRLENGPKLKALWVLAPGHQQPIQGASEPGGGLVCELQLVEGGRISYFMERT